MSNFYISSFQTTSFRLSKVYLIGMEWCIHWTRRMSTLDIALYCPYTLQYWYEHIAPAVDHFILENVRVPYNSPSRDIVLLIVNFYAVINLLGVLWTLVGRSCLNDLLDSLWSKHCGKHDDPQSVVVFRGHPLLYRCPTPLISSRVIEYERCFEKLIQYIPDRVSSRTRTCEIDYVTSPTIR